MTEIIAEIDITSIKEEAQLLAFEPEPANTFAIKTANQWVEMARKTAIPKRLFDDFWFEGEICFLFADTNAGKSILAVQIADLISSGKSEAGEQKVLYFDFELSAKQFEKRYSSDYEDHYQFSDNFYRVEIDGDAEQPARFQKYEDWLEFSFEQAIVQTESTVAIVDNLTYLRNETEKSHIAAPLMKMLKSLKEKYGLSLLVLGHTPKRDLTKPLGRNDLGGSKMLINFCDSAFAIGESFKDKSIRYLKQIKTRSVEKRFDEENVCVFQISKDFNFLGFQPLGYSSERDHLKTLSEKERAELYEQIKVLSHLSQREIARRLGLSVGTVNKYLKRFEHPE